MRRQRRTLENDRETAQARRAVHVTSPAERRAPAPDPLWFGLSVWNHRDELDQLLRQILQDGGIQLVSNFLLVAHLMHQPSGMQHGEMTRNRRPRGFETTGDLP